MKTIGKVMAFVGLVALVGITGADEFQPGGDTKAFVVKIIVAGAVTALGLILSGGLKNEDRAV